MKEQNFSNHSRIIILWHIIIPIIMLFLIAMSVINFLHSGDRHTALVPLGITLLLPVLWGYARLFALRAQDRAIRAEENLRSYILTGKPHDSRLRMGQIIALRFASDIEYPVLAKKAIEENLSAKDIKKSIKNWRADHKRV